MNYSIMSMCKIPTGLKIIEKKKENMYTAIFLMNNNLYIYVQYVPQSMKWQNSKPLYD